MTESDILHSLESLTGDGQFQVNVLTIDNRAFGNVLVVLISELLEIKFIKDRGFGWCEIRVNRDGLKWHALDDVMLAMGIRIEYNPHCFGEVIAVASIEIKRHLADIVGAFGVGRIGDIERKIR